VGKRKSKIMSYVDRDPYGVPTDILATYKYTEAVDVSPLPIGEAQAYLISFREQGTYQPEQYFTFLGSSIRVGSERTAVEAVLKVNDSVIIAKGEGETHADALTNAMKIGLGHTYPQVSQLELAQQQVDVKGDVGSQIAANLIFKNGASAWRSLVVRDKRKDAVQQAVVEAFDYVLSISHSNLDRQK
jgi:hypothetical protein